MSTSTPAAPAKTPGWRLVLDAFMAAPDRTLTNAELGAVRGVQAWHQRISDLGKKGYVVTEAVRIGTGYFAYALVGVRGDTGTDLPHADDVPHLSGGAVEAEQKKAVERIEANAEDLLKRPAGLVDAGPVREMPRATADVLADVRRERDEALAEVERLRLTLAGSDVEDDEDEQAMAEAQAATVRVTQARDALAEALGVEASGFDLVPLVEQAVEALRKPKRASRQPRAERGPTGPALMRKALEHHEQPMHAAKIAEWVLANGGDAVYKGLTPAATMAAQLATSNKTGGEFVKVAPGCYGLREWEGKEDQFGNALLELAPVRSAA